MTQLGAALYRCARAASVEADPTWVPPPPDLPVATRTSVHGEDYTGGDAWVTRDGIAVSLSGESYDALAEMIELLLQERRIVAVCDSDAIRSEALACADEAARLRAEDRLSQAKANELARDLRRGLLGPYEEGPYFVLVPGLALPGPVTIGTVPLHPLGTQQEADDLWQRLADQERESARAWEPLWEAVDMERPAWREEALARAKEVLTPPPKGVCLATAHLAVRRRKGLEMAQEWVQEAIDLLAFFGRGRYTDHGLSPDVWGQWPGAGDTPRWVASLESCGCNLVVPWRRPSHSFTDGDLEEIRADGLTWASAALAKSSRDRTPLERSILLAIKWIEEARNDRSPASALVKRVAALEALLLGGDQPIASTLAERLAFLLGKTKKERILVERRARQVYRARSDFVHKGDDREIRNAYVWSGDLVEDATRELIRRAVESTWRSQEDIAAWVTDRRYDCPV